MKNHWLEEADKRLKQAFSAPSQVQLDRLKLLGIIDEQGRVTGQVHRWDSAFAVREIKYDAEHKKILYYRCFLPVFGKPGGATIDISRDSMVTYLKQGKKIITANWDKVLDMWIEGSEVQLTGNEHIRIDGNDILEDNLGNLPELSTNQTRL